MLVETEAEESERLAEAAKYSDEDSDEDDYRMNFAVPAAAEPAEPAVIVDTERNMEWIKYEVTQKPRGGPRHPPLDHEKPGYNPNILPPSFSDQLIAERKMRMYGHKPCYAPANKHDALRRQNILKRYRDYGYTNEEVDHLRIRKEFIESLRMCQLDMYKDYEAAGSFTGAR